MSLNPWLARATLNLVLLAGAWWLRLPGLPVEIWNADEAVTFTMARQIRSGEVPYRDAVDQRTPLAPFVQAGVFALAGDWNLPAQHLCLALMIGAAAGLVWLTARGGGDEPAGIAAAIWMTPLTLMLPSVRDAMTAHTGWYLMFFSCLGFGCLLGGWSRAGLAWPLAAGTAFGLSFLAKQPGVLDLGVALVLCLLAGWFEPVSRKHRLRQIGGLLAGFSTPLLITAVYFLRHGAWSDFAYYAWTYNHTLYVPEVTLVERLATVRMPFAQAWEYQPLVAVVGVSAVLWLIARNLLSTRARTASPGFRPLEWLIVGWCAAGLYACTLSGRGFTHYAIQLIPGLSLASGWLTARLLSAISGALGRIAGRATATIIAVALAGLLIAPALERRRHLTLPVDGAEHMAQLVTAHSAPTDRIHVWGYNPEIYAHARRLPATRFLYNTFVTGLIPWTNLDPLVDTNYAVVPGAWDAFLEDWERHRPALVVDTRALRGFLKYPLEQQPRLWPRLVRGYAEIEMAESDRAGYRLFKRLEPADAKAPVIVHENSPDLTLQAPTESPAAELRVIAQGPAQATTLGLLLDNRLIRAVRFGNGHPREAAFRLEKELLADGLHHLRSVAFLADGWHAGPPQPLHVGPQFLRRSEPGGPDLHFGPKTIRPIEAHQGDGRPMPRAAAEGRWQADAPSLLVYPLQPGMHTLTLRYGLSETAIAQPPEAGADGIELAVTLVDPAGRRTLLHRHYLDQAAAGSSFGLATDRVTLPPDATGDLHLILSPGPKNNPTYDWSYWRSITANEPPLFLTAGTRTVAPLHLEAAPGLPLPAVFNRRDIMLVGGNSRCDFPANPAMLELTGTFGLLDRAWVGSDKSPAVTFRISSGDTVIFERKLDPVTNADDRGVREFKVKLPSAGGALRFSTETERRGSGAPAFWGDLQVRLAEAASLLGPEGTLFPGEGTTATYGLGEVVEGEVTRLLAHAPATLIYPLPAGSTRLAGQYGILRSATAGAEVIDGVVFVIEVQEPGAPARQLLRRHLDPSKNHHDAGPQEFDLPLPANPGAQASLILRTEPPPSGRLNRAWSYWSGLRLPP